jgi:isoleucyl-tRNA synthetase
LDRWVLSELNTLVSQVDAHLDGYDPTNAGRRVQEFIDQLSNWYVRRSRRRFWRSESDGDKLSGYITLYTCLATLAKLMAPLAPFVAEEIYQGLVCSVDPDAPDSVHLADFPEADPSMVDQPLMEATRLAMRIASMGRGARSRAGLKVRQPLAKVLVKPRAQEEGKYLAWISPQILDELNVKELVPLDDSSDLNQRALEAAGDQTECVVEVRWSPSEGVERHYWVALEGGYMVAVDVIITAELKEEGIARELTHHIQNYRRAEEFEITDRVVIYYQAPASIRQVLEAASTGEYIRKETLSEDLRDEPPPEGVRVQTLKVGGMEVMLGVRRV